ncbi:OLC1v1015610C1 [Oldenlandia corymbosa var. corymbosa]|uniref:OLC1v1015610C1 n=1 Tax=Oldenlandia corymbosa var. corymbosa TaxID=529605 RepID=A0AAV1E6R8_OLDCO|nr:OLC1v1015610C1 [Oldenlandia corymbosa var. corymbosa]
MTTVTPVDPDHYIHPRPIQVPICNRLRHEVVSQDLMEQAVLLVKALGRRRRWLRATYGRVEDHIFWNCKMNHEERSITSQRIPTDQIVCLSQAPQSATPEPPIEELPPNLQEIVKLFQSVQEQRAKYEQLLFYGRNLKPLDIQYKTNENKVEGCVSKIWVRAYFDDDKNVVFETDSDALFTKGLVALLVLGLSGRPAEEIVNVSPAFAPMLGLNHKVTPYRNDGFLNTLKLMKEKALQLYMEAETIDGNVAIHETSEKRSSDENKNDNSTSRVDRDLKNAEDVGID